MSDSENERLRAERDDALAHAFDFESGEAYYRVQARLRRIEEALRTIAEWDTISQMTDLPSPQAIARTALTEEDL